MENKALRPIFWMVLFVMVVGFACNLGGSQDPTPVPPPTDAPEQAAPTNTALPEPTEAPLPTDTDLPEPTEAPLPTDTPLPEPTESEPTAEPTETVAESEAFFIDEFDSGDLSNYSYFLQRGTDLGTEMLYSSNGVLTFDLQNSNTWVYVTYDPWMYDDVRIGLQADNRGVNSQNISLFCRYSSSGWFEFNIGGDGLYSILVWDALNKSYFNIANGGSTLINIGRVTNEYIAECIGNTLTLYINGVQAREVSVPSDYRFMDEGKVGFSVSSFNPVPVLVNIEWFGVEAP